MKLRKLEYKDIPFLLEWMHDEDLVKVFQHNFKNETENSQKKFIDNSFNKKTRTYAIVDENDEYLGSVSLKEIDYETSQAEYAICLRKKCQGTGIATLATIEILKIAFYELNLNRVYLNVLETNIKANKFYNKFGFVYEGKFEEAIKINGTLENLNWYRMLKKEFKINKEKKND